MINKKLLGVGGTATITNKGPTFAIKCLWIEPDSVLVNA
jgi:hypothetical protein